MTTPVLPAFVGLAFPVKRTETWQKRKYQAISGKNYRISDWTYPLHEWELTYSVLNSAGTGRGALAASERQSLQSFFNLLMGGVLPFLYTDQEDNAATGQQIAFGDGATTAFQLVATIAGFTEPVLAPNTVTAVYLNGVSQAGATWSVNAATGILTFTSAPALGVTITADFTYYFRCAFSDDSMSFERFMYQLHQVKSVKFENLKAS